MSVLWKFTGDPGIELPLKVYRDCWSMDPNSLGSTTYPLMASDEVDFQTLAAPLPSDADPRLLFAGEATSQKHFSTMNGARLSGLREALRVLEKIKTMEKMSRELDKISEISEVNSSFLNGN